jgi:hypothetical protein
MRGRGEGEEERGSGEEGQCPMTAADGTCGQPVRSRRLPGVFE